MVLVKVADGQCVLCEAKTDLVELKNGKVFLGVVCLKHQMALLRKWKADETKSQSVEAAG